MPIPRDQLPIGEGVYPDGNGGASFFVSQSELDINEHDGPEWKLEDARFKKEAINAPDAIFQGLKRPGHEESFAYSVRPTHDPNEEEPDPIPPRFGYAFVVFARTGVGGYVVFDWEWREEDADLPGHPVSWQSDFERRTWQQT
jgi:hypothetical protein